MRVSCGMCREDLPSGLRDEEGNEDLLARRVPGNLPSDAGMPPRIVRVPAAAPLWTSKCVKKLVKKEYQVEVPVYKCVVLHLCPECCNGGPTNTPRTAPNPPHAPLPPAIPPAPSMPVPSSKTSESEIDGWPPGTTSRTLPATHRPPGDWVAGQ